MNFFVFHFFHEIVFVRAVLPNLKNKNFRKLGSCIGFQREHFIKLEMKMLKGVVHMHGALECKASFLSLCECYMFAAVFSCHCFL